MLKFMALLASVVLSFAAIPAVAAEKLPAAVASLVDAENAFAAAAKASGIRDAFLAYLADKAIVFNPGPVMGRDLYEKRAPSAAVLSWRPEFAEVSASGNFGYTTGPWDYRKDKTSDPIGFGHFVTVWKKQDDGKWKVALDVGVDHDAAAHTPALTYHAPSGKGFDDERQARAALFEADQAFTAAAGTSAGAAYADYCTDDVRLYRAGSLPILGKEAARDAVGESPAVGNSEPSDARIADSADLGYSIGFIHAMHSAYYLRIWRRGADGKWKIVLDLITPASTE
jgi:ketosteroid isomerase-like protein